MGNGIREFLIACGLRLAFVLPIVAVIVLLTPSEPDAKVVGMGMGALAVVVATGLEWAVGAYSERRGARGTGTRRAGQIGERGLNHTSTLERDLRAVGRFQRFAAALQMIVVVAVAVSVGSAASAVWLVLPVVVSIAIALSALRIRLWIVGSDLVIRSHWRTRRVRLDRVETFVALPYSGLWSGGVSADLFGLYELDVEMAEWDGSMSLPVTMCSRARAERLERALNGLIDGARGNADGR